MTVGGSHSWKSQALKMLLGAVVGAAGAGLFLTFAGEDSLDFDDPAAVLAVMAGLSYGLMGIFVAVGALAPRAGARFLNVEDADEIREQRRSLAPSAIACILVGLFLLTLAMAPSLDGAIGRQSSAWIGAGLLVAIVLIGFGMRGSTDELMRQISLEASALTLHISMVVLAGWALLAHLEFVGWTSPLGLIAGLAMLELFVIFAICAKKGLITPR